MGGGFGGGVGGGGGRGGGGLRGGMGGRGRMFMGGWFLRWRGARSLLQR